MPGEIQTLPVPPNVSIATLLNAIRLAVGTGGGGGGTGDVTGPSSAVSGNVAVFSGTTGKVIADGGTLGTAAFLAATAQSQANTVLQRNANQNTFANNFISNYTSVTSAAGTTVLTAASAHILELTGTTTQTFQLPNATTLTAGSMWQINNNSTGVLTITNNGGTTLTTVPAGGKVIIQALSVATANGTWDYHFSLSAEISCSDTSLILGGKTFSWSNSLILAGTDGSTLNIGAGGTLGTAAFTASSAYVPAASVTGGGVIATGGFTLTVPATGTAALLGTAQTFSAANTFSLAPTASTSAIRTTGALLTGGTGTTNFPHILVQPTGATAATDWTTTGTAIGVNLDLDGAMIDLKKDGASSFKVSIASGTTSFKMGSAGTFSDAGGYLGFNNYIVVSSGVYAGSGGAGIYGVSATVLNLIAWSGAFDRLQWGGTTSSFPCLKRRTTALECRLADDSAITTLVGAMVTNAGAISDSNFTNPVSGCFGVDTTNSLFYIRVGSTWKSVAIA